MEKYEIVRFAIAASLAAAMNLGSLYLAADILGIPYLVASILAFFAGFVVAFILHKWWTFKEISRDRAPAQVLLSLALKGVNLLTYVGLIYLLVEQFGFWHLHAAIVAGAAVPLENFLAFKFIVFRPSKPTAE